MSLKDILPTDDQLKLVHGVERELLRRRRTGTFSGIVAVAWAIIQIVISIVDKEYFQHIEKFIANLVSGEWGALFGGTEGLSLYELTGISVLVLAVGAYLVLRWTSFLQKEAQGPFHYTFFIKPFQPVAGTPAKRFSLKEDDRLHLLNHDLMERLNQRIQRFSLLDMESLGSKTVEESNPDGRQNLSSHIHIDGDYAIREESDGEWVIHVMPRVRIGPRSRPETLAYPVRFPLTGKERQKARRQSPDKSNPSPESVYEDVLTADQYNQLVERVYSSIATEVYKQIKSDVREKIALFPSNYLRAVALFHEAKDFERSNTIDSYDYAIELYRESKRYFDIANIKWISRCLLTLPMLWRLERRFLHMDARTRIGYSRCMIYRRVISALSGRSKNPLFETRDQIESAIDSLEKLHRKFRSDPIWVRLSFEKSDKIKEAQQRIEERRRLSRLMAFMTFPGDSILRRSKPVFDKLRHSFFDAHIVAALAYYYLDALGKAKDHLDEARSVAPDLSVEDPLYLLAAAEIEPDLNKEIFLFQQATDRAPDFEIAQHRLAYYSEMRFRAQNEITEARAGSVIREYDEVLRINPGNIASLAAQAYLLWLLGSNSEAEKKFEEGCAIKATVRQTFIGELNYGLARIAAEEGRFNRSYDLYREAISADPGVGAYSVMAGKFVTTSYYNYIGSDMLKKRYKPFKEDVVGEIKKYVKRIERSKKSAQGGRVLDREEKDVSLRTLDVVRSFVLNDYGNACLNYFHRFGDLGELENAIEAFEDAKRLDPENAVAYYNLANAYGWRGESGEKISELLGKAEKLAPAWPVVLVASAEARLRSGEKAFDEAAKEIEQAEETMGELKKIEDQGAISGERGMVDGSQVDVKGITPRKDSKYLEAQLREQRMLQERGELREKYRKHLQKAIHGYDEARGRSERLVRDVLPKVEKIVKRTKLSSMFEGLEFDVDGKGVDELLSNRIEKDRLDENDVEALRVWAQVLSNNYWKKTAIVAAEQLANYILMRYSPENYDLNMILRSMYRRQRSMYMREHLDQWSKVELGGEVTEGRRQADGGVDYEKRIEECDQKIEGYTERIKPVITDWLDKDPIHYASLMWTPEYFQAVDLVRFFEKAIEELEKAKLPQIALYHTILGDASRELKKWEGAKKAYLAAVSIEPNNAAYYNMLGNIYFESGDFAASVEPYRRAIEIERAVAVYHANLGGAFRKLGEWPDAEKAYQEAIDLEPNDAEYQNMLGNIYYESGDFAKSIGLYRKAIGIESKRAVYYANLGGAFRDLEEWEDSERAYRQALEIEPENSGYLNMLGIVHYRRRDYKEAIDSYREAIAKDPKTAVYHANLVLAYEDSEKHDEAERAFSEAIELGPNDPRYQNELGDAFSGNGDYERAIVCYKRAIEKAPGVALYCANLGASHRALGQWEEAEKAYCQALETEPEDAAYQNMLGNIYFERGDFLKSIGPYQKAIEIDPTVAVYHANLGGTFRKLGEWQEAEKAYREAAKIEPKNAAYQNMLGNVYFERGDFLKSLRPYQKAIEIDPGVAVYHANLGGALKDLGRWEEAEKSFQAAIGLDPENASYHNMLGVVYYRHGVYEKAVSSYKKAIAKDPRTPVHHANLVLAYEDLGRKKEAKQAFRDAVAVEPDNPDYQNELGDAFWANRDHEKAIGCYKTATKKAPSVAAYHARLGAAFAMIGQWQEAEKAYLEALQLEPDNAEHYHFLGDLYDQNGNHEKAGEAYAQAVRLNPGVELYRSKLEKTCTQIENPESAKSLLDSVPQYPPDKEDFADPLKH